MYSETRKINLIQQILKVKSSKVLTEMEAILNKYTEKGKVKPSIYDFVGFISGDEAAEMNRAIEETCEIIDENDWK
jgi:hypothetical protein